MYSTRDFNEHLIDTLLCALHSHMRRVCLCRVYSDLCVLVDSYLQEHIAFQHTVLDGLQLTQSTAGERVVIVVMRVLLLMVLMLRGQDAVFVFVLVHNGCEEKGRGWGGN